MGQVATGTPACRPGRSAGKARHVVPLRPSCRAIQRDSGSFHFALSKEQSAYHKVMPAADQPSNVEELAELLRGYGDRNQTVSLGGAFTKQDMGGMVRETDVTLSTSRLNRILLYEPKDLTISVEAGLRFRDLEETLNAQGQCLPLDPPLPHGATVGGVIATNGSGPRRRRYGTARDMVIGMTMVTIDGKTVKSGGMVVKNVTGLDMAKLLIGSFGTLAAIASVNFKVFPKPEQERTFVCSAAGIEPLLRLRTQVLTGVLQPVALDLLNPAAVERTGLDRPGHYALLLQASGNRAVVARYEREYSEVSRRHGTDDFEGFAGEDAERIWAPLRNFTADAAGSVVIRVSSEPKKVGQIFKQATRVAEAAPLLARGASGVAYLICNDAEAACRCLEVFRANGLVAVVESGPAEARASLDLWVDDGAQFAVMRRIKDTLDPNHLLNPGRLFSRI